MKSKNESPSLDYNFNLSINNNNYSSPEQDQKSNLSNNQSYKCEGKKSPLNQESLEPGNLKNFNISFFLPKDLNKYIEGEEENPENKINSKNNNNDNSPIDEQKNNDNLIQENEFDFFKNNNYHLDFSQNNNNMNSESIEKLFTKEMSAKEKINELKATISKTKLLRGEE